MLIGLCGPRSAGKRTVAEFLAAELGFSVLADASCLPCAGHGGSRPREAQFWRHDVNAVVANVPPHHPAIPVLLKRPYFLLVYVDAPLLLRFARGAPECGLEGFVRADDALLHGRADDQAGVVNGSAKAGSRPYTLSALRRVARVHILNEFATVDLLWDSLSELNFTDPERLRPGWDAYFMSLARLAAERTNCMKRRVGCVIAKNSRMVATGYNGTPSGVLNCFEGGCDRCNGAVSSQGVGLDLCLCLHAEENAIIEAGRERCEGATLYTNLFPCILCSKKIIQAGIARLVFETHYATDGAAEKLLRSGKVVVDAFRQTNVSNALEERVHFGS